MMHVEAICAVTREQLDEVYRIRRIVFVEEQGVAADREFDEHEAEAVHVLALHDGEPAGAGRVRTVDGAAKIERVCVLKPYRRYGVGRCVMEALEAIGRERGLAKAKLHAQTHAEPFYRKLGYETVSDVFQEEDIPHVVMVKKLN